MSLSRALSQLSEVEMKITQLHADQADADFFVLSELIKDYITVVQAIKVFTISHCAQCCHCWLVTCKQLDTIYLLVAYFQQNCCWHSHVVLCMAQELLYVKCTQFDWLNVLGLYHKPTFSQQTTNNMRITVWNGGDLFHFISFYLFTAYEDVTQLVKDNTTWAIKLIIKRFIRPNKVEHINDYLFIDTYKSYCLLMFIFLFKRLLVYLSQTSAI